jgi:hypothetical protein
MSTNMYSSAVMDPIIPFLTNLEYGRVLSTNKEINATFDWKHEWKRRSPSTENPKQSALIKGAVEEIGAKAVLFETTSLNNLRTLMSCYKQILQYKILSDLYYEYMNPDECPPSWYTTLRLERTLLNFSNGSKLKPRKRKRVHDPESYIHMRLNKLQLCR